MRLIDWVTGIALRHKVKAKSKNDNGLKKFVAAGALSIGAASVANTVAYGEESTLEEINNVDAEDFVTIHDQLKSGSTWEDISQSVSLSESLSFSEAASKSASNEASTSASLSTANSEYKSMLDSLDTIQNSYAEDYVSGRETAAQWEYLADYISKSAYAYSEDTTDYLYYAYSCDYRSNLDKYTKQINQYKRKLDELCGQDVSAWYDHKIIANSISESNSESLSSFVSRRDSLSNAGEDVTWHNSMILSDSLSQSLSHSNYGSDDSSLYNSAYALAQKQGWTNPEQLDMNAANIKVIETTRDKKLTDLYNQLVVDIDSVSNATDSLFSEAAINSHQAELLRFTVDSVYSFQNSKLDSMSIAISGSYSNQYTQSDATKYNLYESKNSEILTSTSNSIYDSKSIVDSQTESESISESQSISTIKSDISIKSGSISTYESTSVSNIESISKYFSESESGSVSQSESVSDYKLESESLSTQESESAAELISASQSESTSNSTSASEWNSASASQSIVNSESASAWESDSISKSGIVSESASEWLAASQSESTSNSTSASEWNSASASQSIVNSESASAWESDSISISGIVSESASEWLAASQSESTSNSTSASVWNSASASQSTVNSESASAWESDSVSKSGIVSESASEWLSASQSESTFISESVSEYVANSQALPPLQQVSQTTTESDTPIVETSDELDTSLLAICISLIVAGATILMRFFRRTK